MQLRVLFESGEIFKVWILSSVCVIVVRVEEVVEGNFALHMLLH